jgi:hypothetical protein
MDEQGNLGPALGARATRVRLRWRRGEAEHVRVGAATRETRGFVLFCDQRCGAAAADNVMVSEAVLQAVTLYFGPTVDEALARLTKLAESAWFVSEALFRSTAEAETKRLLSYGCGVDTELFGICFGESAPHFLLLRCNTGVGVVHKRPLECAPDGSLLLDGKTFGSIADFARTKLDDGCGTREASRWANSPARTQKVHMLDDAVALMSGYGSGQQCC